MTVVAMAAVVLAAPGGCGSGSGPRPELASPARVYVNPSARTHALIWYQGAKKSTRLDPGERSNRLRHVERVCMPKGTFAREVDEVDGSDWGPLGSGECQRLARGSDVVVWPERSGR